ncbi:putative DNA metabolism protein [Parabacteroides sp. PFB2-12]|uniref:TIGR03915 family putative DNA repair protein n=1 Tax=unclassified Parabacteroides TaxID=2649774 RepID=UPI002474845C|nr:MULTISPECIES: TIGR03915 family putative DNA repair protein [unclassified Parabacteroides]MDH6342170.1 putative DNA metabolism protein [Parabacteroides sp. PM6-13]MDH6391146.1 putative DNA metabolism protein [Parabacteroides sp. PFB2-12]
MIIFIYDNSLEGLLTAVFDAYSRKTFPDILQGEEEALPLFYDELYRVITDTAKADRVWKALEKKLSKVALSEITVSWLSELPEVGPLIFRYIRKNIDAPQSVEMNFGDPDVLALSKIWKKVGQEKSRLVQFLRFQKAADGTYFAAMEPLYNVLPLAIPFLKDRYADQRWLVYDLKREYGYYYDLQEVIEVRFEKKEEHLLSGFLSEEMMDKDEKLFQQMWKQYHTSIAIQERKNPKLQRSFMPVRFWKYLTEKR